MSSYSTVQYLREANSLGKFSEHFEVIWGKMNWWVAWVSGRITEGSGWSTKEFQRLVLGAYWGFQSKDGLPWFQGWLPRKFRDFQEGFKGWGYRKLKDGSRDYPMESMNAVRNHKHFEIFGNYLDHFFDLLFIPADLKIRGLSAEHRQNIVHKWWAEPKMWSMNLG